MKSLLGTIGLPGVIIAGAFVIYPPLGWLLLILGLFVLGIGMLAYGGWLLIPQIPLIVFIWWSWDTIVSWGFLGWWGALGVIIIPLILMCERAIDKGGEHLGTGITVMIWLGIAALFSTIVYWNIAQWVYGALFLFGCILAIAIAEEKENEEKENV